MLLEGWRDMVCVKNGCEVERMSETWIDCGNCLTFHSVLVTLGDVHCSRITSSDQGSLLIKLKS